MSWGVTGWSTTRNEVCIGGGSNPSREKNDLWVYDFDKNEIMSVLNGQIGNACWSSKGTELALCVGLPYSEIWTDEIDPNIPTIKAFGPAQTPNEHYREMLAFYSRRIEADSEDAYAYSSRAHYYDCLHEREKAIADMRRWSAILSGRTSCDLQDGMARKTKRILNGPFNCQFVFSAERLVNETPILNVALGQKGRCSNMKTFQIPILSMSLLGLCLLSGLETQPAHADFTFGDYVKLESVIPTIDPVHDCIDCLSYDGLEIYISSDRPGINGSIDIWVARRASIDDSWGPLENLGSVVNTADKDQMSSISADGLKLYFMSDRPGGYGGWDIWVTERATINDSWGPATNLGPKINTSVGDGEPWISQDGLELYVHSLRPGGYGHADIYVAKRETQSDLWGEAVNLGPVVNSEYDVQCPSLSPDGLLLLFCDGSFHTPAPGGYGGSDIWMSRRTSISDPWQAPINLGPLVNGPGGEYTPRISPDGHTLYYWTNYNDIYENWQTSIEPVVDFNVDGIVDAGDVCIMIEHWYTDEPLCDIGPMPWGDGIVDVQDLIVIAEHLFEEYPPAEPIE